jgi:hypothetical protein
MPERVARPGPPTPERLTNAVLDFRPSRHGFHFVNRFEPGLVQRILEPRSSVMGLCGGMVYTVADLFERRIDPPPDRDPPARGTRRFRALYRRQLESFDWGRLPLRFWRLAALHRQPARWWSRALRRTPLGALVRDREWPRIRAEIDAGRVVHVGLVREACANPLHLTRNHQVLAYGYRVEPGSVTVRVYDPNWPDRDDVELRLDLGGSDPRFEQSTGEPLHGFFLARYRPAEPRAWRTPR